MCTPKHEDCVHTIWSRGWHVIVRRKTNEVGHKTQLADAICKTDLHDRYSSAWILESRRGGASQGIIFGTLGDSGVLKGT